MDFPAPEPNDNEEVAWAIQTAHVMWKRGDGEEAIRWLQRGATAAEDAGDDMRLLVLARAAAEFSAGRLSPASAVADPTPTPSRTEARLHRQQTAIGLGSALSSPSATSSSAPPSRRAQPPPLDRVALAASSRPSNPVPDAEVTSVYASAAASAMRDSAVAAAHAPAKPASATSTPLTSPIGAAAPSRQSLTPLPTVAVGSSESRQGRRSSTHQATRVSVTPSNTPGTLNVRPLAEGERLQPGAREALLVPLHPGEDLFG